MAPPLKLRPGRSCRMSPEGQFWLAMRIHEIFSSALFRALGFLVSFWVWMRDGLIVSHDLPVPAPSILIFSKQYRHKSSQLGEHTANSTCKLDIEESVRNLSDCLAWCLWVWVLKVRNHLLDCPRFRQSDHSLWPWTSARKTPEVHRDIWPKTSSLGCFPSSS